jgi:pimeloyl-ACP methyl ester carboxylesterase
MKKYFIYILIAVSLIFTGCRSEFGVEHAKIEDWIIDHQSSALVDGLSVETTDFLLRTGNLENYHSDPEKMLKKLYEEVIRTKDRKLVAVLVELCYNQARLISDRDYSVSYYLSSAVYAYFYLFSPLLKDPPSPYEPEFIYTVNFYNFATAEVFRYLRDKKLLSVSNFNMPFLTGKVKFTEAKNGLPYGIKYFNDFILCFENLPIGFHNHTRQSGLGVPLIAIGNEFEKRKDEIFDISKMACPGSFFIRFKITEEKTIEAHPEYYDAFNTSAIDIYKYKVPLEIDLSSYLGFILKKSATVSPIMAMINPERMLKAEGLYILTPYNKNKIPVVFVHGLMSNARTWGQMLNTLLKYKDIREKYQFWFFVYPTANPVLYSAAKLRKALNKVRQKFDPEHNDAAFDEMVLVGHSLGGILSKMMVQTPGNVFLKKGLNLYSIDKLDLTKEQRKFVEEMIMFKRLSFVSEVIFLNVPHRGSETTRDTISVWAAKLIHMPEKLVNDMKGVHRKPVIASGIENSYSQVYISTGVDNLDPDNGAINIIADLPIDKNVKYHSIIGNEDKAGIPGGTDGIVSYLSAHLDGAESEIVILSDHGGHKKPEAIMEVRRILLEHLQESSAVNIGGNDKADQKK